MAALKIGDRVCIHYMVTCGNCFYCHQGNEQFCSSGKMIGKHRDGGYAEYIGIPARNAFVLPPDISFAQGAIMMCSSATSLHALRKADVKPGESVAVFGIGRLGLSAVQLAFAFGALRVFAIDINPAKLDRLLGLVPHPGEGGYYRETWRSAGVAPETALPAGYAGERSFGTAIYFLITPDSFSALHRVRGDELFHFYLGDPVEMFLIFPGGLGEKWLLGNDLAAGRLPQRIVPGGVWQGLRLVEGGRLSLLGTTMAPGFAFGDFEAGERGKLVREYPALEELIMLYTS